MWLLTGRFEDEFLRNLEDTAKENGGFSTAFFLLNAQDVLEERQVLAQPHRDGANLQLIEEDIQKHDKAATNVLCASSIYHRISTEVACANLSCLMKTIT